jgi:hypothetical protein
MEWKNKRIKKVTRKKTTDCPNNSMEQSRSWGANSNSASQKIFHVS